MHGCAIVQDEGGHHGIVVVGGAGDSAGDGAETSVEFLDLETLGATWVTWPNIQVSRCCWPQVKHISVNSIKTLLSGN